MRARLDKFASPLGAPLCRGTLMAHDDSEIAYRQHGMVQVILEVLTAAQTSRMTGSVWACILDSCGTGSGASSPSVLAASCDRISTGETYAVKIMDVRRSGDDSWQCPFQIG